MIIIPAIFNMAFKAAQNDECLTLSYSGNLGDAPTIGVGDRFVECKFENLGGDVSAFSAEIDASVFRVEQAESFIVSIGDTDLTIQPVLYKPIS
jgi:hypothetical protein